MYYTGCKLKNKNGGDLGTRLHIKHHIRGGGTHYTSVKGDILHGGTFYNLTLVCFCESGTSLGTRLNSYRVKIRNDLGTFSSSLSF